MRAASIPLLLMLVFTTARAEILTAACTDVKGRIVGVHGVVGQVEIYGRAVGASDAGDAVALLQIPLGVAEGNARQGVRAAGCRCRSRTGGRTALGSGPSAADVFRLRRAG